LSSGPWHLKQCDARTGRISRWKSTAIKEPTVKMTIVSNERKATIKKFDYPSLNYHSRR
jgi:hypothetical protein